MKKDKTSEALIKAVKNGDVSEVKRLIPLNELNHQNSFGATALHFAASKDTPTQNDVEVMAILVEKTDASHADIHGQTALHLAASYGFKEAVEMLLPISDVSAVTTAGNTARDLAKSEGHEGIVHAIDKHQSELEAKHIAAHVTASTKEKRKALTQSL